MKNYHDTFLAPLSIETSQQFTCEPYISMMDIIQHDNILNNRLTDVALTVGSEYTPS